MFSSIQTASPVIFTSASDDRLPAINGAAELHSTLGKTFQDIFLPVPLLQRTTITVPTTNFSTWFRQIMNGSFAGVGFFLLPNNLLKQMGMPHRQELAPCHPADLLPSERSTRKPSAKLHRQSVITVAKAGVIVRD